MEMLVLVALGSRLKPNLDDHNLVVIPKDLTLNSFLYMLNFYLVAEHENVAFFFHLSFFICLYWSQGKKLIVALPGIFLILKAEAMTSALIAVVGKSQTPGHSLCRFDTHKIDIALLY